MLDKSNMLGGESIQREVNVLNFIYKSVGKIAKYYHILDYINEKMGVSNEIRNEVLDIIIKDLIKYEMIQDVEMAFHESYELTSIGLMALAELNYK